MDAAAVVLSGSVSVGGGEILEEVPAVGHWHHDILAVTRALMSRVMIGIAI